MATVIIPAQSIWVDKAIEAREIRSSDSIERKSKLRNEIDFLVDLVRGESLPTEWDTEHFLKYCDGVQLIAATCSVTEPDLAQIIQELLEKASAKFYHPS